MIAFSSSDTCTISSSPFLHCIKLNISLQFYYSRSHRAGNYQNRTFLIRILILGGFRFELLDRAPGQFLSISTRPVSYNILTSWYGFAAMTNIVETYSTWLVSYTILTIGIGFAERYRIVKDARRGSHLIIFSPRRKNFTIFNFAATPYSMENIVYLASCVAASFSIFYLVAAPNIVCVTKKRRYF